MKYNADFIATVALVQNNIGSHAAKLVFDKLFDVAPVAASTPAELLDQLAAKLSFRPYGHEIRAVNRTVGTPYEGWSHAVAWIKEFRTTTGCGLKEAKDTHDFVRDNPEVSNA